MPLATNVPFNLAEEIKMLEDMKEELIVNKVGGRFKLSTLIQKRLVALNKGSRPLVQTDGKDNMQVVIQEILQDKIFLDTSNEVKITGELDEGGLSGLNPLEV